jgi:deazaflavin-dependent oxidoreductase (nitroreductase family)
LKKTNPNSNLKDSDLDREQYLYLTTRGRKSGLPREIEIWFKQWGGHFYLIAEYSTSHWLQNLQANPTASIRIAGEAMAVRGRVIDRVAEPKLHQTIADLSCKKYGWGDGTVVELVADSPGS